MTYQPGSKCFAKVKGYSPWPARIDILPSEVKIPRGKYPVFFYGTHEVCYVAAKDIYDYEKYRHVYAVEKAKNIKYNDAVSEMNNNSTIYQLGCDPKAVKFLSQFYKFDAKKSLNNIEQSHNVIVSLELSKSTPIHSRKRKRTSEANRDLPEPQGKQIKLESSETRSETDKATDETPENHIDDPLPTNNELKDEPPVVISSLQQSQEKNMECSIVLQDVLTDHPSLRKNDDFVDMTLRENETSIVAMKNEDVSVSDIENSNISLSSFKSPIESLIDERPKRASAIKFKQNLKSLVRNLSTNQKGLVKKSDLKNQTPKIKTDKKKAVVDDKKLVTEEAKIEIVEEKQVQEVPKIVKNPVLKKNEKKSKINDDNYLRIVSKLSIIDKEIKRSLVVGQEDHDKCRLMMNNILELSNLTLVLLCRVPEIVVTIRKCRRYKKDASIKISASKIFQNFLTIYDQADFDEKIEAGTELLKRDCNNCKSAQTLLDELFIVDKIPVTTTLKHKPQPPVINHVLSSPSSAVHSVHSSANNTPVLTNDCTPTEPPEIIMSLDPDLTDINELINSGTLELMDTYICEDHSKCNSKQEHDEDSELYRQLGV